MGGAIRVWVNFTGIRPKDLQLYAIYGEKA